MAKKVLVVTAFSIIVHNNFNGLAGKISRIVYIERKLLIPNRVKFSRLGLSPLSLFIKVYFHKRTS
jgi:hypothetical protein